MGFEGNWTVPIGSWMLAIKIRRLPIGGLRAAFGGKALIDGCPLGSLLPHVVQAPLVGTIAGNVADKYGVRGIVFVAAICQGLSFFLGSMVTDFMTLLLRCLCY